MSGRRRVVVTGLGCVSPVGNTVAESWASLMAGRSGIARITKFDASGFTSQIAGEVKGLDVSSVINTKEAKTMDTFIQLGLVAAAEAVADAGLPTGENLTSEVAERIGCVIGSGIGGLPMIEQTQQEYAARGGRRSSPGVVAGGMVELRGGDVCVGLGCGGSARRPRFFCRASWGGGRWGGLEGSRFGWGVGLGCCVCLSVFESVCLYARVCVAPSMF